MGDPKVDNRLVTNALRAFPLIPKANDKLHFFIGTLLDIDLLPNIDLFVRKAFTTVFYDMPIHIGAHLKIHFLAKETKKDIDSDKMQMAFAAYSSCLVSRLKKSAPVEKDKLILPVFNRLVSNQAKADDWLEMLCWLYCVTGEAGYKKAEAMAFAGGLYISKDLVVTWLTVQYSKEMQKEFSQKEKDFCKLVANGVVEQIGGSWELIKQTQGL